ncbi:MAG: AAA family ATPase [Cyanobacteriota bacterium]|nr:AAA family ATPase [Cyanobacteriota bacterium]
MPAPLSAVITGLEHVLLGKPRQLRLALACLLARGHLLIEDLPGLGKSTLAEGLARSFDLAFQRVSFTSDLLPADLTGVNVLDPTGQFRFHAGPLFSQVLLADEINRASPRTQSALLEAMAAARVSVDGQSHDLPRPFLVIATQNGLDQGGTAPLPESQLDRFLMRLQLGFPERQAERALLQGEATGLDNLAAAADAQALLDLQQQAAAVAVATPVLEMVLDLLERSRAADRPGLPLSPRAGLALLAAARAWALLAGRHHVRPDDVHAVATAVLDHRMDGGAPTAGATSPALLLLEGVDAIR